MLHKLAFPLILSIIVWTPAHTQDSPAINWLTFEQLEDSLAVQPKKVFIDFYTSWCTYCRKMDRQVFTQPEVIRMLNEGYYAIRFDAESDAVVSFGNRQFINDQLGKRRSPIHQIAQLLTLRNKTFVAPAIVVLDENFNITNRYFEYMSSQKLVGILE